MDGISRINELVSLLNEASKAYYNDNNLKMTDLEFDKLYDELVFLEKETGFVLENSPTQKVGWVVEDLVKVEHESKLLSLDKTKEIEKLKDFIKERDGILSLKLDGLTVVVKYDKGRLVQAITRGNGEIGEDVTHNALVFRNLPKKIEYKEKLTVRGEAIISFSEFKKINSEDETQYKNTRNLTSGTVRQLDNKICEKRNVDFFAFAILNENRFDLKSKAIKWLKKQGFETVEFVIVKKDSIEKTVNEFKEKAKEGNYGTDGLVLTYDEIEYSNLLGVTSKYPKDSLAFKWTDETAETVLKKIEWSVSRTGLINPIAVFEPVEIEGTTVERASLHNVSIVEELELGVGDKIVVYKANMIIPQIAENITKSGIIEIPDKCSECGKETKLKNEEGIKTLYCENIDCLAQVVRRIAHYASRDALNIEGLSIQTIEKFVEMGFLKYYTDIYKLEDYEKEIKEIKGFGEKSYNGLIKAIENSKDVKLANFIYGLGISQVGLAGARLLCEHFNNNFDEIKKANKSDLIEIQGFGEIIAESLILFFDKENIERVEEALTYLRIIKEEEKQSKKLNKNIFVITGDTKIFNNRKELENYIIENGGKVTSSISTKTNYLINNDIFSNSSKNRKAKELGVEIISEVNLLELAADKKI